MVSIIMPVYNAANYIDRAVCSVLNQTYSDYELLLVDDGCPYGSGKLCDKWAEKDNRIKSFHKPNGGTSDARNFGIEKARGEYIIFIDCDDFVLPNWLSDLYSVAVATNADIIKSGIYYVPETDVTDGPAVLDYNINPFKTIQYKSESISPYEFHVRLLKEHGYNAVWNQLVKSSILKKCPFPAGHLNEDYSIFFSILEYADNIQITDFIGYCWGQRTESQSRYRSDKFLADMICDFIFHYKMFKYDYNDAETANVALLSALKEFFWGLASSERIFGVDPCLISSVWEELYEQCKNTNIKEFSPNMLYLQYFVYKTSPSLYKRIINVKKAILK